MYFGELADKSFDYQAAHCKGIERSFDYISRCIKKDVKLFITKEKLLSYLSDIEIEFNEFCDTYGHGLLPDDDF